MKWLFLLPISLFAQVGHISSDTIGYEQELLMLDGNVEIEHSIGHLSSHSARLKKEPSQGEFFFSRALLKDDVLIRLRNNATLECQLARLDFNTLLGDFTSDNEKVIYRDTLNNQPLTLKSRSLNFKITPEHSIDTLMAVGDVVTRLSDNYRLTADRATFYSAPHRLLRFDQTVNPCEFESDSLQFCAHALEFDALSNTFDARDAKGTFLSTRFEAKKLDVDLTQETLTLHKNILLDDAMKGVLRARDEVKIFKQKHAAHSEVSHVKTKGPMEYRFDVHEFYCEKQSHLNRLAQTYSANGSIVYTNEDFAVYADHVKMIYREEQREVEHIELSGNILLVCDKSEIPIEMATCDRLHYTPDKHLLTMSALDDNEVRFWNRDETLNLIAQNITLHFDPDTHKKSFDTTGRVRCNMTKPEQEMMLKLWKNRSSKSKVL